MVSDLPLVSVGMPVFNLDSNNISNTRIAAKLLSPKKHIKDQKYNLFIEENSSLCRVLKTI
jgi:hypothetical protein